MAIDPRFPRPGHARALTLAPAHNKPALAWHLLAAALLLLATATGLKAQVAINATGAPPATPNAMLDISSTTKGLLVPRMTAAQRSVIVSPDGLMVYQTDSTGSNPAGYYYYDATTPLMGWRHIGWNNPGIWQLGGNAGTTSADFLGTTNLAPLIFRITNYDRGRLNEFGQLQFYSAYPAWPAGAPSPQTEQVHVQGGVKLSGGSAGDNEGNIRFVPASGGTRARFEGNVANTLPAAQAALLPTVNGWKQLDNNFYERKLQETPKPGVGCQDPSDVTVNAAAVTAGPRPWPIPGPSAGFTSLNSQFNPYFALWEDGRRQYLFQASDLAAKGLCPGPSNPIRAIAFNVNSVSGTPTGRIHFLRFRMKNTAAADVSAGFDNSGLIDFSNPVPPNLPGPPSKYTDHGIGYDVVTGWNVHGADVVGNFFWAGSNLLIDAALDDQEWSTGDGDAYTIKYGNSVDGYNTSYPSLVAMYCDACGGNGGIGSCTWKNPPGPGFYFPPTTPINGDPGLPGSTVKGWGWTGGWFLTAGVNTAACDGAYPWGGGGPPSILQQLPRVAFLAKYTGGGPAYDVGSYMVAQDGLMVGDAAWAASGGFPTNTFRGPGTLSAKRSVWSGGSLLSDHVFDLYYSGTTRAEDAKAAAQYVRVPLQELPNYVERERRLPNVQGRNAWNREGGFSVDQLTNQLWVAVEDQALYIQELNQRMDALRQYLVEKKLKELEGK